MRLKSMFSFLQFEVSSHPPCRSLIAALLLVVVFSRGAAADQPTAPSLRTDVPLSEQLHRDFYLRNGLPSSWMNDVIQTRDDYVWIATDNGLVRYDGINFKWFSPRITPQLPSGEIRVLYESRDGYLWIGTTVGLTRHLPGRPGRFEKVPAVSGKTVRAIYEDSAGTLWIGTRDETYVRGSGLNFEIVEDAPTNVRAICEDHSGTLWFGSHSGLFRRQGKTYEQITHERLPARTPTSSGIPQTRVNAIVAVDGGGLWIGTNRALLHMLDGQFTSRGRELDSQQVYDILQTRNGGLYVAARFGLFRSVGDGPLQEVSSNESAFSVMEDRAGGLWVGHGDNRGLHHYRNHPAQAVWTEARVRCVFEDSEGDVWFGANDGLHRLRDGVITDYGLDDGLPDLRVQTIVQSRGKTLWIGTARGFVKWSGTAIVPEVTPAPLAEMNIAACLEDSAGVLWFSLASAGGFTLRRGVLTELPGLSQGRIHWYWEDSSGIVWIGHESGLFQHRDGEIRKVNGAAVGRLKSPRFLCHFASGDGTLWMGTSNGIVRHQSGDFTAFTPECGLQADNIERMAADQDGNLWFGGRDGLFHTSIRELDAVATGRLSQVSSYRVEGFDRFPPLSAFSQGCLVRNGALWIVAEHGLMRMPLEPFQSKPPPPIVHIEHAAVDGLSANFENRFEYLAGSRRLSIQFSVPAFVNPRQVHVRYRLDRHDNDWVDAGSDRVAHYTGLLPGEYRFRVSGKNGNDNWIEADPSMSFTVLPRWWELIWLRVTALLITVVAGIGFIQYRIRNFRRVNATLRREIAERQRAEEASRNHQEQLARVSRAASMGELSTSIAHEVKQPLFAIVSNAQTARRLLDRDEPDVDEVREALSDIADDGNRASDIIDRVRSLVKKERQVTDDLDLNQVARDASNFAEPEIRRRGLVIETDFANDLPHVKGDPIELQQVILNLLINGSQAMHDPDTGPRTLALRTSANNGSVELAVEDHGSGAGEIPIDKLFEAFFTTKPQGTGMGLAINRTIIEAHGGRIWATQNRNGGLTFRFSLPAGQSFVKDRENAARQEVPS
jgi:signal transduction histidine kinase/ligand-binding sensor domain-containing protein